MTFPILNRTLASSAEAVTFMQAGQAVTSMEADLQTIVQLMAGTSDTVAP